jgi:hypothetical protein
LSDKVFSEPDPTTQSKENIKKMFMENAFGKNNTGQLKLSDFIDENFFEDVEGDSLMVLDGLKEKEK